MFPITSTGAGVGLFQGPRYLSDARAVHPRHIATNGQLLRPARRYDARACATLPARLAGLGLSPQTTDSCRPTLVMYVEARCAAAGRATTPAGEAEPRDRAFVAPPGLLEELGDGGPAGEAIEAGERT